jgi:hypothetical protein
MSEVERLRRKWPEKSVVFWRVQALYLSADNHIGVESLSVVSYYADSAHASRNLHTYFLQGYVSAGQSCVMYSVWNPKDNYDMSARCFCSSI